LHRIATEFCDPTKLPPGLCVADYETERVCVQSPAGKADPFANRFPVELDRVPFFNCAQGVSLVSANIRVGPGGAGFASERPVGTASHDTSFSTGETIRT
jgi:hypothetical protein